MILLEIFVCVFIYLTSYKVFEKTVSKTLERTKEKTTQLTESINEYVNNLLMNYITKLKLISKQVHLFNGKNTSKENEKINKKSKIFLNKDLSSRILPANITEINKHEAFHKIFNTNTQQFDYLGYYMKKFYNDVDDNIILNTLRKEHDELNYISYYNISGPTNIDYLDEVKKKNLNFLIPILKTIFIQRFLTRKLLMDIIRIYILNPKELIIYPPEDINNLYLNYILNLYPIECGNFPTYLCIYGFMMYIIPESKYFELFMEIIRYQDLIVTVCIKFTLFKGDLEPSLLCIEVNLGEIVKEINLHNVNKFEFGFFNPFELKNYINTDLSLKDLYIISNCDKDAYNEFHNIFTSSKTTPFSYILDDSKPIKYYSLYHFLYWKTTKIIIEHPELNVNIKKLEEEYEIIKEKAFNATANKINQVSKFQFNKTTCRKKIIGNKYECFTDEAEMNVKQLITKTNILNDDLVETNETSIAEFNLFIYSIVFVNTKTNMKDIKIILSIKLSRIILLYFSLTLIILSLFFILINLFSSYSFDNINNVFNSMDKIEINEETKKLNLLEENKGWKANKEMLDINEIYNLIRNSLMIKEAFNNKFFLKNNKIEIYKIVQDIKDKNIKEICNSFLGIYHFDNKIYFLSETELRSIKNYLIEYEKKLKIGDEYDKIKDTLKRSSTDTYLNEYSSFGNIEENILMTINLNIYKQRIIYYYAMTKYYLGNELDDNKMKKVNEKREKYFKDAIKYFKECKDINELLGINQIKSIYILIMISKCYINLKDYKNSVISINEALSSYFKFSKTFTDCHSRYYNPRIMLFVETNIFHYIISVFSRICSIFKKPYASNYFCFKILDTSPFILSNIHYHAGLNLLNFLEKNKTKIFQLKNDYYQNLNVSKEFDKLKKHYAKIVSRLYCKIKNGENIYKKKIIGSKCSGSYKTQNQTIRGSWIDKSKVSSSIKGEITASKISSVYHYYKNNRKLSKNITICLSEKILAKLKGQEFKDFIINNLQKYFINDENDKFSFIQFANNGKKSIFLQPRPLNEFIIRFYRTKTSYESTIDLSKQMAKKKNPIFTGLYGILDSIIKNCQTSELNDNIIMLFMDSEDIRFSSIADCMNIVEELNKNNTSIYFFCYNETINAKKINNVQSFLKGLIEGYLFDIKNYQQIIEVFVNLSNIKHQTNFFKYKYNCFDCNL